MLDDVAPEGIAHLPLDRLEIGVFQPTVVKSRSSVFYLIQRM